MPSLQNPSNFFAVSFKSNVSAGLKVDATGDIVLDQSFSANWTSKQKFSSGINVVDDIEDSGTVIWDSDQSHLEQSALENDSVTISGSNGLSGGDASLGGSTTVGINGTLSLDSDLEAPDGETIWDESNGYIPESAVNVSGAAAGSGLSKSSGTLSVNLGTGIEFDGSDNIQLDQDVSPTWTSKHVFDGGIEFGELILTDNPTNQRLVNAGVTTAPADGDEISYVMEINSETIAKIYAQADGSGGVDNKELRVQGDVQTTGTFTEGASL